MPDRLRAAASAVIVAAGLIALATPGPAWAAASIAALAGVALLTSGEPADRALYAGVIAHLPTARGRALARAGVVLTSPLLGLGVVFYSLAAVVLVVKPRPAAGAAASWRTATGVGLLGLAVVAAAQAAGVATRGDGPLWAVLLVGAGLSLFWGAGAGEGGLWFASDAQIKTIVGSALTVAGVGVILDRTGAFGVDAATLVGAVVVLLVIAFVFVPRALVSQRRISDERRRREREQERAEVGEMLHDSVLQTLALIQRREDTPAPVAALARRQERELRDWLLRGEIVGQRAETLDEGLRAIVAAIEDDHDAMIETVIVGDALLSPAVEALLAATREALLNAVKHGDGADISLFAKISESTAAVFVRDRGPGFDPSDVIDETRRGIRSSIIERMQRVGGYAEVYTAPGEGCEVELGAPL